MDEDPKGEKPTWASAVLGRSDAITRVLQAALTVAGILGTLATEWKKSPILLSASVSVLVAAAAWFAIGEYLRRRRPARARIPRERRSSSSYFRSLLPFEKGDRLLGRDQEAGQLLALLRSLEFRVGFLSGEAGAGKTSLLRAAVVPELERDGKHVVYVPRTGNDPEAAIRKELIRSVQWPAQPAETDSLTEVCRQAVAALSKESVVLIIDQFEEYFVSRPTPQNQDRFERSLREISQLSHDVRLLFTLRKEFVDDLLDFAKTVPALQNFRWRLPLRNFSATTAQGILSAVSHEEGLPLSEELQERVIIDLARDGLVRPVEFQIVLTTLLAQGVNELSTYQAMQGAQGVIARFVGETIEPQESKLPEVELAVARQVLRDLCNDQFTTRRPLGLTRSELLDRMLAELPASTGLSFSRSDVESALDRALLRFVENYVVILEDRGRHNLIHDYLAAPIREATSGVETAEERAHRILDQYVAQARVDRNVVIPWKTARFITRFAGRDRLLHTEAAAVLSRSRTRHHQIIGATTVAALVSLTLFLPHGVQHLPKERLSLSGYPVRSADGRLLVVTDINKHEATVVRLDLPEFSPHRVPIPLLSVVLSPRGESFLAVGVDGSLYRIQSESHLRTEKLIDHFFLGRKPLLFETYWASFSRDGSWSLATSDDGKIYVWPSQGRPRGIFKIDLDPSSWRINGRPVTGLTEKGEWLWAIDRHGNLYMANPSRASGLPAPVEHLSISTFASYFKVIESPTGNCLAISDQSPTVRIARLTGGQDLPTIQTFALSEEKRSRGNGVSLGFSPDGRWLVARASGDEFYSLRIDRAIPSLPFPAVSSEGVTFDYGGDPTPRFDATSTWAAGRARDGRIYAWRLASPPGAVGKAATGNRGDFDFGVTFCPDNRHILVNAGDGSIHSAALGRWPLKFSQIGRIGSADAQFRFASDGQTILAFDSTKVATGSCTELHTIFEGDSNIVDVVGDGDGHLIVITERGLLRLRRSFFLWGLPIWPLPWPEISPAAN